MAVTTNLTKIAGPTDFTAISLDSTNCPPDQVWLLFYGAAYVGTVFPTELYAQIRWGTTAGGSTTNQLFNVSAASIVPKENDYWGILLDRDQVGYWMGFPSSPLDPVGKYLALRLVRADQQATSYLTTAALTFNRLPIERLDGVSISSPSTGQVLKYDGTNWVNGTDATSGGTTALNDISDVTITSPSTGQVLKYNGSAWVNDTDATGGGGVSDGDKGDITVSSSGTVWTIDAGAVTLSKMAAQSGPFLLGNNAAGTNTPQALTAAQATGMLDTVTSASKGLVPNHPNNSSQVLRGNGTWGLPIINETGVQATGSTGSVPYALSGAYQASPHSSPFYAVLGSDATATTTTLANVTGMDLNSVFSSLAAANKTYLVELMGIVQQSASTAYPVLALDVPTGATVVGFHINGGDSVTYPIIHEQNADNAILAVQGVGLRANNANYPLHGKWVVTFGGTSGNIQLKMRVGSSGTATLKAGSVLSFTRVN